MRVKTEYTKVWQWDWYAIKWQTNLTLITVSMIFRFHWKKEFPLTVDSVGLLTFRLIDRLSIIWKSNLTDKMKRSFFQAAVVSILLYRCTTWTLTKRLQKKLDGNYTRMLRAILNKSWQQHPTRRQLYVHLPPITRTIQARRTRHDRHCWRSKDEIVSDVLLWTPAYGQSKAGRPARTFIQQLCDDTGCNTEDLRRRWMIGRRGERWSGISVLAARHDDDDDDDDVRFTKINHFYTVEYIKYF